MLTITKKLCAATLGLALLLAASASANAQSFRGRMSTKEKAAYIGGGAAAGALIGGLLGGKKGAVIGGLLGLAEELATFTTKAGRMRSAMAAITATVTIDMIAATATVEFTTLATIDIPASEIAPATTRSADDVRRLGMLLRTAMIRSEA